MMLVPSLMCILIPLSALLCSGKFDTVAKIFSMKFLIVNMFARGINRLEFS